MEIKDIAKELIESGARGRVTYIMEYLSALRLNPSLLTYHGSIHNVEVRYTGCTSDSEGDILIAAHHDISYKTREGANDNTSSVAVLLKVASLLRQGECRSTIRLLFNDNEELLGGINHRKITTDTLQTIMGNVGSYLYFRNDPQRAKIRHTLILELSGIGDAIYIAERSGMIETDRVFSGKLAGICTQLGIPCFVLPIPSTDMLCVKAFGLSGTVAGAVPYYQAKHYQEGTITGTLPVWSNMHSDKDSIFTLNHRALDMVLEFVLAAARTL